MATESDLVSVSFPANTDLSAKQFYLVTLNSGGSVALGTGVTDQPIGILQNKPLQGEPAQVAISGKSKFIAGGSIAVGAQVGSDSAGKGTVITVAAGGTVYNYAVGRCTQSPTAANQIGQVVLYAQGLPLLV